MRIFNVMWYSFLILGVLLMIGAMASTYNTWEPRRSSGQAQGIIVGAHVEGPLSMEEVRFATPDGQNHLVNIATSSPRDFSKGMSVPVLYELDNPSDARIDLDPWSTPRLLWIWSGGFCVLGGLPLFFQMRKAKQNEWLKLNGQMVVAAFDGVHVDRSTAINGRNPYKIRAHWNGHVFNSSQIWTDPTRHTTSIKTISVLIDPANPKRYWMDLTFLPKPH